MNTRLLHLALGLILTTILGTSSIFAQDGTLDPTFDSDGIYIVDISATGVDVAYAIAEQSNGKLVVAGHTYDGSNADALVMRLNADGTPDLSFDADGKVVMDLSLGGVDRLTDVAIQADGKIVCVGYMDSGNGDDVVVIRLLPDGSYDNSFGTGGKVQKNFEAGQDDQAHAVALYPDGRILIAGRVDISNSSNLLMARFTSTGLMDNSFDLFGSVTFDPSNGGEDGLYDVEIAPDGKIVATGYSEWAPSNQNMIIVRVDTAGQPDISFSSDGFFNADLLTGATEYGFALKVMPDGGVLVAGSVNNNGNTDASLVKVKSTGILDNSFSSDGVAYYDFTLGSNEVFRKLEMQSDGKIIAGGYMDNVGTNRDFLAAKIESNGDLDASFGVSGWASADISSNSSDNMRSMCLMADGRIMLGGYSTGKLSLVRFTNEVAVGIAESGLANDGLDAWPVPFAGKLKVDLPSGLDADARLQMVAIDGKVVLEQSITASQAGQTMELGQGLESLSAGIYHLRLQSKNKIWTSNLLKH